MYEALRQITSTSPEGKSVDIAPGEVVVGFEAWPLRNQLAAINMHLVRTRQEGLSLAYRSNHTQLREERERLIAAAAARGSGILQRQDGTASPDTETQSQKILRCGRCDYTTHSGQGLKTHLARKHKV